MIVHIDHYLRLEGASIVFLPISSKLLIVDVAYNSLHRKRWPNFLTFFKELSPQAIPASTITSTMQ